MDIGQELHFAQYGVGVEPQAVGREGVEEHVAEFLFVGSFADELCHDGVKFGVVAVVGEVTGVGHHAGEYALCGGFAYEVEQLEPAENAEQQICCRRHLRMRYHHIGIDVGAEMMVDEYFGCFRRHERFGQAAGAARLVEVEAKDEVGLGKKSTCEIEVFGCIDYFLGSRQAAEVGHVGVGYDNLGVLAYRGEYMSCRERRSDGIAVGPGMAYYGHMSGAVDERFGFVDVMLVDFARYHLRFFILQN